MTSLQAPARSDRWLRAVGYGVLAEISTIITIVVMVLLYKYVLGRGLSEAEYTAFGAALACWQGSSTSVPRLESEPLLEEPA